LIPEYIPYIKYVISPGTRFERDRAILFDPKGDVAQGKPLVNYGWGPTGLKEFVEALYKSRKGNLDGFEAFYRDKILGRTGDIVQVLRAHGLVRDRLPALLRIKVTDHVEVPALLVDIDRVYFKRCSQCKQSWRLTAAPIELETLLRQLKLDRIKDLFQCSRQACRFLCSNYDDCTLNYTSTEDSEENEARKTECLEELISQIAGKSLGSRVYECIPRETVPTKVSFREGTTSSDKMSLDHEHLPGLTQRAKPMECTTCIERQLRFDFHPRRYFFFDQKTWEGMQGKRYSRKPMHNIDALPSRLLSDFIESYEAYLDGTQLVAPVNHGGVFEAFLNVSNVSFEIRVDLEHRCDVCSLKHGITGIPIKAMFRDSDVFKQEAGFARLLWEELWRDFPRESCQAFGNRSIVRASESPIIKREMKVKEICPSSAFSGNSYDYAVDLRKIGGERLILFDLTTGLWKKSGFHEIGRTADEYVEMWSELLFEIPQRTDRANAIWYVVINSTEESFFDSTAPEECRSMKQLVELLSGGETDAVTIARTGETMSATDLEKHKLIVLPVFNSTPARGEARWEVKRLDKGEYGKTVAGQLIHKLFS